MRKSSLLRIAILGILALVSIALFLGYHLPNRWQYALNNRALTISAIVITGIAIALATMLFQEFYFYLVQRHCCLLILLFYFL